MSEPLLLILLLYSIWAQSPLCWWCAGGGDVLTETSAERGERIIIVNEKARAITEGYTVAMYHNFFQ